MTEPNYQLVGTMRLRPEKDRMTGTGIYIRALGDDGYYGSYDIGEIDTNSLFTWLRSRGGNNPWAEGVVMALLNHPPYDRSTNEVTDAHEAG